MLLNFLSHLLTLGFNWIAFDLVIGFIVLTVAYLILAEFYRGDKSWLPYFFFLILLLYGILDFAAIAGFPLISRDHMLEWLMFQFAATMFLAGTRLQKHTLKIMVACFLGFSFIFA